MQATTPLTPPKKQIPQDVLDRLEAEWRQVRESQPQPLTAR